MNDQQIEAEMVAQHQAWLRAEEQHMPEIRFFLMKHCSHEVIDRLAAWTADAMGPTDEALRRVLKGMATPERG